MLRPCLIVLLFTWLVNMTASGQTRLLDSLLTACDRYTKLDTVKVKMLTRIAGEYQKTDPNKGIQSAEEAISIARSLGQPFLLAEACNKKGANLTGIGAIEDAIPCFEEALHLFESVKAPKRVASMLGNIAAMYGYKGEYANALVYNEKALQAQKALGDIAGKAKTLGNLGTISMLLSDYPKALGYFDQAIVFYQQIKNTAALGNIFTNQGSTYSFLADYPKALECHQKALTIAQQTGNTADEADYFNNIGVTYYYLGDYPKALEYQQKALTVHEKIGDKRVIARDWINMSSRYKSLKNYPAALESLHKAQTLLEGTKDQSSVAYCLSHFGGTYFELSNFSRALEYEQQAFEINEELEDEPAISLGHKKIAQIYCAAPDSVLTQAGIQLPQRFSLAEERYLKGLHLAQEIGATNSVSEIWVCLSQLYEKTAQYAKAYDAFKNYIALNDSILGEKTKKEITRKEIQYEFDKKETMLRYEQQLTVGQLEKQKLLSLQQQQALTISNKEKDLQRLAYLQEKAEKQEKEQQLSLAEKDKLLQEVQLGSLLQEKALQLKTLAQKNALIGLLIAGLAAILLGFAAFYWWMRQKQANRETAVQAQFTRHLLENIEDERGRIALDLHDSISHELLTLKNSIRNEDAAPGAKEKIDGIINGIRQISRNLHPVMLDKIGLRLSLETLCEQFMQHETLFVSHQIDYQNTLSKPAELQVFRIVQEALTNVLKYAQAEAVKVQLQQSGQALQLEIQDNGKGFDVQKALDSGKAFGLHSLLQRAKAIGGHAEIKSGENGTTIRVTVA